MKILTHSKSIITKTTQMKEKIFKKSSFPLYKTKIHDEDIIIKFIDDIEEIPEILITL